MGDFEFFSPPSEGGEAYDPAAFERFKDQVKKNGAFVAAIRKDEARQKKKEDRLVKILLKFIQTNQHSGILMLAARLLEENIPASFILSIIILGNEEMQQEIKREIQGDLPQIPAGEFVNKEPNEFSLMPRFADESLPLKVRAEIDSWGKGIFDAGSAGPFRVLETILNKEGELKKVVVDCAANVLSDYMENNGLKDFDYDSYFSFAEFLIKGIAKSLKKQVENQKELN